MVISNDHVPPYAENLKTHFQIGLIATFTQPVPKSVQEIADHYFEYIEPKGKEPKNKKEIRHDFKLVSLQVIGDEE